MKKKSKLKGMIITCCALLMIGVAGLSFTLAKYVDSVSKPKETARVAKFGITMTWSENNPLFSTSYEADDTATSIATTVTSSSTDAVIAPGTEGSVTLTFGGTSEVAFKLKINMGENYSGKWEKSDGGETYHPIKFEVTTSNLTSKVGNATATPVTFTNNSLEDKEFAAGTTLEGSITIKWYWPFEVENGANDAADTHIQSITGNDAPKYSITATASITQID